MKARLSFVHALSPLHAGTGQGIGVIDLPIARERSTGIPFLPGSSLKGTLRDLCDDPRRRSQVFGPEKAESSEYAGGVHISDQRLLLLPVRSLTGTFAWVTSPYLLQRFVRDVIGLGGSGTPVIPEPAAEDHCRLAKAASKIGTDRVWIEELELQADDSTQAAAWAGYLADRLFASGDKWRDMLTGRFCIVHDDVLTFLLATATEITARIKLQQDSKTVEKGGLWYEESLPTESILSGLVLANPNKKTGLTDDEIFAVLDAIVVQNGSARPVQLGGKATVGRGICNVSITAVAGSAAGGSR